MKHILITGASSGIGQALALEYAGPNIHLSLCGRNQARLEEIAYNCRQKGASVDARVLDVTDRFAMTKWLMAADKEKRLDLVIANAGISGGSSGATDWEEATRDIFTINLAGTLNTILPVLPIMVERGQGQIALVSSMAGFRGLASSPAYSASKAATKAYGEALRIRYRDSGVKINIICPGFVESRITEQNKFKMPFLMTGQKAAKIIRKGLAKNKAIIIFPWQMALAIRLFASLPYWLVEQISRLMPTKE